MKGADKITQLMGLINGYDIELTSSVLLARSQICLHEEILRRLELPLHHDHTKNWDSLLMSASIIRHLDSLDRATASIFDTGSGSKPWILKIIEQLYTDSNRSTDSLSLASCDLVKKSVIEFQSDLSYRHDVCDSLATPHKEETFDVVYSMSMIEHGIDLDGFFKESSRVLKPGGVLLLSTDYWPVPVVREEKYPYPGLPALKIFTKEDIDGILRLASEYGLSVDCRSFLDGVPSAPVVRWDRMDEEYTFCFIKLTKTEVLCPDN